MPIVGLDISHREVPSRLAGKRLHGEGETNASISGKGHFRHVAHIIFS
jgi:hypothetical protein